MGSSGGGGSSGAVSYPQYMMDYHLMWMQQLAYIMDDITKNGVAKNPYFNIHAISPYPFLDQSGTMLAGEAATINAFLPQTLFPDVLDAAKTAESSDAIYSMVLDNLSDLGDLITSLNYANDWPAMVGIVSGEIEDSNYDAVLEALLAYKTLLNNFLPGTVWADNAVTVSEALPTIATDDTIRDDALAYAQTLEDEVVNRVLPRFKSGMRDVNAVMNSAFVMGQSVIWGMMDRDVAKYLAGNKEKLNLQKAEIFSRGMDQVTKMFDTKFAGHGNEIVQKLSLFVKKWELNSTNVGIIVKMIDQKIEALKNKTSENIRFYASYSDTMTRHTADIIANEAQKITWTQTLVQNMVEHNRMSIVALKENLSEELAIEESAYLWNAKLYQYAGNLMASIGSGAVVNTPNEASRTKTALGGALSGAAVGGYLAAGTAMGGPVGAGLGAIVGLGMGLL